MKKILFNTCLFAASSLSLLGAASAQAATESVTIEDSTNLKARDTELFNLFNSTVNTESLALDENLLPELFADSIKWDGISDSIDVVFINEGAAHRNQLLFSLDDGPRTMLFDDLASTESILKEDQSSFDRRESKILDVENEIDSLEAELQSTELTAETRAEKEAALTRKKNQLNWRVNSLAFDRTLGDNGLGSLKLGDSKSISGLFEDVSIDFFIKANGARNQYGQVYGADAAANADGLQHLIAREFQQNDENWVLLGFEDLYGVHHSEGGYSDRDFNDVVVAVRGVTGNRVNPEEVPEPMATAGLIMVGALGLAQKRRQRAAQ